MISHDYTREHRSTPAKETNQAVSVPHRRPFWSHPVLGYLGSPLLVALGVGLLKLEHLLLSNFHFPGAPFFFIILLVAYIWGLGPALFTVFLSMLALDSFYLPPPFVFPLDLIAWNGIRPLLPFVVVGSLTAFVTVQREATRRRALAAERLQYKRTSQLEAIVEAIADAVVVYDREGQIVETNSFGRHLFQLAGQSSLHEESLQKQTTHVQLTDGDGRPLQREQWPQVRILGGETLAGADIVDMKVHQGNGSDRYANVSGSPLRDQVGNIVGAVCIYRDVTVQKQLEQKAQKLTYETLARASELEATFESIADCVTIFDEQGIIRRANQSARQLFSFADGSSFAEQIEIMAISDEQGNPLPLDQLPLARVLRGEVLTGTEAAEVQMTGAQRRRLNISVTGAPIRTTDGCFSGAILVLRDVTKRRQLERRTKQALSALLSMAETLVRNETVPHDIQTSGAPAITSAQRVIVHLAELAQRVLGCQRASVSLLDPAGKLQPAIFFGFSDEQEHLLRSSLYRFRRTDASTQIFARLLRGDVQILDTALPPLTDFRACGLYKVLVVPLLLESKPMGMFMLDAADADHLFGDDEIALVQATARLIALVVERDRLVSEWTEARANEMSLRETKRRMDEFLGMASHELRTPLTAVSGYIQIAEIKLSRFLAQPTRDSEGITALFEALLQLFRRSDRQAELLNLLVNDLVDVSRIQSDKLQMHLATCDVGKIVSDAVDEQRQVEATRSIGLSLPPEAVSAIADADRIGQVIRNYLTNALKYSKSDCAVAVRLLVEGKVARVEVSDQGPGLLQQELEHVWERFYQVEGIKVQSGSSVGLGIGLHICRTIVTQHHGEVGVRSTSGQGSTFWFTLPLGETVAAS